MHRIQGQLIAWSTGETAQSINVVDGGIYHVTVNKRWLQCNRYDQCCFGSGAMVGFYFSEISGCMPVKYKFTDNSTACESTITGWFWEFGDGTTFNTTKS